MSTLPAASSFSGSAVSEGTTGFTSSPTARKSPWAIAAYSGAWSALGNQSSITVNGLAAGAEITSCLAPQAASAQARRAPPQRRPSGEPAVRPPVCASSARHRPRARRLRRWLAVNEALLSIGAPTARAGARRG